MGAFSRGEERRELDVPDQVGKRRETGSQGPHLSGVGELRPDDGLNVSIEILTAFQYRAGVRDRIQFSKWPSPSRTRVVGLTPVRATRRVVSA